MIRRVLKKLDIDRLVAWKLLTQATRFGTSIITMVFAAQYLKVGEGGYIGAFGSILGVSIFVELGLSQNIVTMAAQEFDKLRFNRDQTLGGDLHALSRLRSLSRVIFSYYAIGSILFWLLTLIGGFLWLKSTPNDLKISWEGAWLIAVSTSALSLAISPGFALLHGCQQMGKTEKISTLTSLIQPMIYMLGLILNWGIYAFVLAQTTVGLIVLFYLGFIWRRFFSSLLSKPIDGHTISWKKDLLPQQLRLFVSFGSGFLIFYTLQPIIFKYCGAIDGDKMYFAMNTISVIFGFASSWILSKLPRYGSLIGRRDWDELNRMWKKNTIFSCGVMLIGGLAFLTGLHLLAYLGESIALNDSFPALTAYLLKVYSRFPSIGVCACLIIASTSQLLTGCFAYYLRSFKEDPYVVMSVIHAASSVTCVLLFSLKWKIAGAAFGYMLIMLLVNIPAFWIFIKKRREYTILPALPKI